MINNAILFICLLGVAANVAAQDTRYNLTPAPASIQSKPGRLAVTSSFSVAVKGYQDERLRAAIVRTMRRFEARAALALPRGLSDGAASLVIQCQGPGKTIPALDEDESYSLEVSPDVATLAAPTVVGAIRGLETFLQLLSGDRQGFFIPLVSIQDRPRFPWRGLMIDIARHWQPMDVIKRNLDGMAAVKLNVLHLHITEDQGFRIESRKHPELHRMGSDGDFYTQDQMREIIEYARMRGIRVVPEFDMPGHATSWLVSHPELGSQPGPYQIERKWGIFDPALDPTNEAVYQLLEGFLGEMAALFPDAYLHIGGDENEGKHWNANQKIQAFIKEKGLKDNHGLQAYFNRRVMEILKKNGKKMIGWDEILHPDLPNESVIQSWRGPQGLAEAAKKGYAAILSNGYYIDLMHPTWQHYLNDPIPENTTLTPQEQKLILGGEATMWSEWTSPETIDSRIWPRMAAIAERFWSPREIKDVDEMYRRLAVVTLQLEDYGLLHRKNPPSMLRRWVGGSFAANDEIIESLRKFIAVIEPVKNYMRGRMQDATQFTPLTRMVDIAQADSGEARLLARAVDEYLSAAQLDSQRNTQLKSTLAVWGNIYETINSVELEASSPNVSEAMPLMRELMKISRLGIDALNYLGQAAPPPAEWKSSSQAALEQATKPSAAVELAIVQPIKELMMAAIEVEKRKTMPVEEWKKHVKSLAMPKKNRQD